MSLSVAVLDALMAAGATREQIVAAVKADIAEREAIEAARMESKRAGNRERQQRKRAKDADVTAVTRDNCDEPLPLSPPLKSPPHPQKITPPISPTPDRELAAIAVAEWNELAAKHGLPRVTGAPTGKRKAALAARLKEHGIEGLRQAFAAVGRSPFCRGETGNWRASFDFVLQASSFQKLREGTYDPPPQRGHGPGPARSYLQVLKQENEWRRAASEERAA